LERCIGQLPLNARAKLKDVAGLRDKEADVVGHSWPGVEAQRRSSISTALSRFGYIGRGAFGFKLSMDNPM
jgi:hypothetical protein